MIQALRESPEIPPAQLAKGLSISVKTARTRFNSLVEENAVSYFPEFGIRKYPGTIKVFVTLIKDRDKCEKLAASIEALFPNAIRNYGPGTSPLGEPSNVIAFLVAASSDAELDDASLATRNLSGVMGTRFLSPQRFRRYVAWTDERIQAFIGPTRTSDRRRETGSSQAGS
jgi:hypothetical protein